MLRVAPPYDGCKIFEPILIKRNEHRSGTLGDCTASIKHERAATLAPANEGVVLDVAHLAASSRIAAAREQSARTEP